MAQRVLVFEKDTNFIRQLESGFREAGYQLEVVRDAETSIARAREGDVRLVLVSVEAMGAPGEAFLVCKRFKSDDDLARVPFVIMGGKSHAESFESHKKLKKRRADEYLELPISFRELFAKVAPVAGFQLPSAGAAGAEAGVVDEDIDAFAENAFGELLRDSPDEHSVAKLPPRPPAPPISARSDDGSARRELELLQRHVEEADQRARDALERASAAEQRVREQTERAEALEQRMREHEQRAREHEQRAASFEQRVSDEESRARALEQRAREEEERAQSAEQRAREEQERANAAELRVREEQERTQEAARHAEEVARRAEEAAKAGGDAESAALTAATREAEERAREQAERIVQAETRAQEAEARAREFEGRARETASKLEHSEARIGELTTRAEVLEKKLKELPRPSAPPPATTMSGISSRDYLELREQLNRKEKELLTLREQVTQRDRQLLDASDRSLQLERLQAELEENLQARQRELDEQHTKVRAYEVDREVVNKRLEDLRTRLGRAEDKGKRLEDELEGTKTAHARESDELRRQHAAALAAQQNSAESELARVRGEHESARAEAGRAAAAELERVRAELSTAKDELEGRLRGELADAQRNHEQRVASLEEARAQEVAELRSSHASELDRQARAADDTLATSLADAARAQKNALEALAAERAQELDRRLGEAERARIAALAGLEQELSARHAAARRELAQQHTAEVDALSARLAESQARETTLTQRLEALEDDKRELEARLSDRIGVLEAELAQRTDERDRAHNEIAAMRASIAALERTGAQLTERVAQLERDLARASDRIAVQSAKIAEDKEILDRVRRALGIGIGLLEQQKQNVV